MLNVTTTEQEIVARSIVPRRDDLTSSIKNDTTRGDVAKPTGAIPDRDRFDRIGHVHFAGIRLREWTFQRIVVLLWFLSLLDVAVSSGTLTNPSS